MATDDQYVILFPDAAYSDFEPLTAELAEIGVALRKPDRFQLDAPEWLYFLAPLGSPVILAKVSRLLENYFLSHGKRKVRVKHRSGKEIEIQGYSAKDVVRLLREIVEGSRGDVPNR